ncbi:MAG: hypothetical protein P4L63_01110 [Candidatus Pacebacteria bacterium]|nr:hypothetical protein [Candidatus Paceibacterota bacterium]
MKYWLGRNTTRIFLGIILFFVLFFGCLNKNIAAAQNVGSASLFFSNPSTTVKEGDEFTINVEINSPEQSINAVSGTISFPGNLVHVVSINKDIGIIKLWTQEPKLRSDNILFEGIILNPGFQGNNGIIFSVTFQAEASGVANLSFSDGAILANNGLGTNILATLAPINFNIIPGPTFVSSPIAKATPTLPNTGALEQVALVIPTITKYFPTVGPQENLFLKGKGTPFALTQISFRDISVQSLGDKFVAFFQGQKNTLGNVIVENDKNGNFHYLSGPNLVAGVYNATPALVNTTANTATPGASVQLLVSNSIIVKDLVVFLNILGLLIPIVFLIVIIYFIPWYSWRRMRIMKEKMLLEEEKVEITEAELKQKSLTKSATPDS